MSLKWIMENGLNDPGTPQGAAILAMGILIVTGLISRVLTYLMRRPRWVTGKLKRKVDPTAVRYIVHFKTLMLFLIAFVVYAYYVPALRALVGAIAASAGITALVVGFAARSTLSNIVSGMALALYRPIRIGDKVTIDNEYGTVEDITLRHTIVVTWEHKRLIIPNEKLDSMSIVNHTIIDPKVIARVEVGVSYDTNLKYARQVLEEVAGECPYLAEDANPPWVSVVGHGESSIVWRVYIWVPDVDALWSARFWLFEAIKHRFDERGIEIPFPYRTVVYKKDLPAPVEK
ncbi:MAG: mechanosensitive ion channel family protein [Myxococcota bacterium]|nr:mechanosensitive ion channel family protein [Myxococcota bacterium]